MHALYDQQGNRLFCLNLLTTTNEIAKNVSAIKKYLIKIFLFILISLKPTKSIVAIKRDVELNIIALLKIETDEIKFSRKPIFNKFIRIFFLNLNSKNTKIDVIDANPNISSQLTKLFRPNGNIVSGTVPFEKI